MTNIKTLKARIALAKLVPGAAHLPAFGLVLPAGATGTVCELCRGRWAPIVDGRHLGDWFKHPPEPTRAALVSGRGQVCEETALCARHYTGSNRATIERWVSQDDRIPSADRPVVNTWLATDADIPCIVCARRAAP
jgi:hypothetical protein